MYSYRLWSDDEQITFEAESDKVALICAVIIGEGDMECRRIAGNIIIPSCVGPYPDNEKFVEEYLGMEVEEFVSTHLDPMAKCMGTFKSNNEASSDAHIARKVAHDYEEKKAKTDPPSLRQPGSN